MSRFSCLVQEHSAAHGKTDVLEGRLIAHHADAYPGERATVRWTVVPPGFMFTEGRPSTSSIISCDLAHATSVGDREAYMRGICDIWTEVTACTDHEVVVSITEAVPITVAAVPEGE